MKILVTGSEGFIGSYVVKRLLALGHEVMGVDSLDTQVHHPSTYSNRRDYPFQIAPVGYCKVPPNCDAVIHLAAMVGVGQSMYQPARYVLGNSHQTAKLLEMLVEHKPARLVVASSMSVYGEGVAGLDGSNENDAPDLRSIYALTKYDQEQLSLIWGRAHEVPTVALRFFNTYGPGQALQNPYTGALAIFATRLLNGKAPVLYEDGQQTRDFIYVEDVAEAVVRAATTPMEAGVYNVGTGVAASMELVARQLAAALYEPIEPLITGKHRAGDIRHCYADISKLKATGWTPKTGLSEGLHQYAMWLVEQPLPVDRFEEAAKELEAAGLVR